MVCDDAARVTKLSLPQLASGPPPDHLLAELRGVIRGNLRFGRHERMLYATDASIYQVEPLGVVEPIDRGDVERLLRFCNERRVALLPRGGGTSLAGQGVNRAIVCDLSPSVRRAIGLDTQAKTARVQTGMSIDEVN